MRPSAEPFKQDKYKALMDGLKCKEVFLSETYSATNYFRLEAEYYNSTSVSYHQAYKGCDVVADIQYGTSKYCDEKKEGYPVLRLNELDNGFIGAPQKYCNSLSIDEFDKLRLKKGDVLIIRTNGNPDLVGRAAVVMEDTDYAFASYLYRVIPNDKINSEILVVYMNCKYGRYEIDKNSIKGNQTNFSPAKFRDINIPKFGVEIQEEISKIIGKAHQYRVMADVTYSSAEELLNSYLKTEQVVNVKESVSIKTFSESFGAKGRLDSEYYQPRYDALFDRLQQFNCKKLGGDNGIVNIMKSIEPGSDEYKEEGIPFVRVSDMSKFDITEPGICLSENVIDNAKELFPKKDTILFSKDGSVGIAYKMENDARIITSSALLHLRIKNFSEVLPDYLTLVLNSPIVQLQAERDSNGAIIKHWKPSEIENVDIPLLDMKKQEELAKKIRESFEARRKSKDLIEYAKASLEIAIENNEKKALKWLREKGDEMECQTTESGLIK